MNKRLQRERRRLRRIEFLVSLTLVFSMTATGFAIVTATAPGVAQEQTKTRSQQEMRQEETPATEPERAAEEQKTHAPLVRGEAVAQVPDIPQVVAEEPEEPKTIRYEITAEELDVVARVVQAEAGGEGYDGQALVAQCILNTAEAKGIRPDEVVLAPGQYTPPAAEASEEVKKVVTAVFLDGYQVTEEPVRYFYAPARCVSTWHETALEFVLEHGGHKFFQDAPAGVKNKEVIKNE